MGLVAPGGAFPLCHAAQHGHTAAVQCLLETRADVNQNTFRGDSNGRWTALYMAAGKGHTDVVQALLSARADFNIASEDDGCTPLHWAAENNRLGAVRVLVNAGADVNTKLTDGITSLWQAAYSGHTEVVRYLMALEVLGGRELAVRTRVGARWDGRRSGEVARGCRRHGAAARRSAARPRACGGARA